MRKESVFLLLCAFLVFAGLASAQGISRGSIAGTVTDPTGAVIPGVRVTVTNTQTGVGRQVETNASGVYVVTSIPAGVYDVAAEATGFQRQVIRGVDLEAEQRLGLDITMEVGEITTTVEVTGAAPVLETETGEVASLVSNVQVAEMPINGRNWSQFAILGTGVAADNVNARGIGQEGNPLLAVHGQRTDKMRYAIDGIQNMDTGGQRGINNFPPPEAIQEIKFLKSNFRAESGSYGAGVGNVVSKSGGQEFHGTVYEFFRNNAMDASNFFATESAPLQLNHFGFTVGGPVYFGNYNRDKTKSFFFYSQSIYKRRGPALGVPPTLTARTPTEAMRAGDFSGQGTVTNPDTDEPFANNQIPASMIDLNATIMLDNFFPLPNNPAAARNYVSQPKNPTDSHQEMIRWDQNFTDNTRLMVRYLQDDWEQKQARALWAGGMAFDTIGSSYAKPGKNTVATLTNIISPTLLNDFTFGFSWNTIHRPLIGGEERPSGLNIPELFPDNPGNKIPDINLTQGWGSLSASNVPYDNGNPMLTFRDDLAKQAGNHSLKFGFEILRMRKWVDSSTRPQGAFTFDGGATGHSVADFMLGRAFSYNEQEGGNLRRNWLNWQYDFYAQDDWKITPNFTFNYGLRYSIFRSGHTGREDDGLFSMFQPALYDVGQMVTVLPNGRIVPGSGEVFNGLITPDHPRSDEFGGFDLYRTRYSNFGPRAGIAWSIADRTVLRAGAGIYYGPGHVGREGFGRQPPFVQQVTLFNTLMSNPGGGSTRLVPQNINSQEPEGFATASYQWSFGIQQEISNTLFDITYVGNRGSNLYYRRNLNKPMPDPNRVGSLQAHRLYPGWGNILYDEASAQSSYHGLELHVNRRYSNGLMYEVSYTWSKSLGMADNFADQPQDNFNLRNEWSYVDYDRPHVFVANWLYELPYGRSAQNSALSKIAGGWAVGAIVMLQSGRMGTVSQSGDPHNIGGGPLRPNRIGDPNDGPETVEEWFNTAAFVPATPGVFGNAAPRIVRLPGLNNWTLAFYKNTSIGERVNMQIRAELFNAFNHPNLAGVQMNINSGVFGQVTSANDPRIVQLGLKFDF